MLWLSWLFDNRLGRAVAALIGAFAFLKIYGASQRREGRQQQRQREQEVFDKRLDKIDEVQPSADRDSALKRLRDRNK